MSEAPYDYDQPGGQPPDQPPLGPDPRAVKGRVTVPAIFLIIVGVLNLLAALWTIKDGFVALGQTPAQVHDQQVQTSKQIIDAMIQDPEAKKKALDQIDQQAQDPQAEYTKALAGSFGGGAVALIVSLLILFGGVRMMGLKSYGLAVTGAILAAIPCISFPSGCCCIGEIAGIWALIVLLNSDVRSAFR